MLEIKDLKVNIENKEILKGINLKVNAGEVHAIMGPNGSGKAHWHQHLPGVIILTSPMGRSCMMGKTLPNWLLKTGPEKAFSLDFNTRLRSPE